MAKKKTIPTVQVRVAKDVAQLASIVAAYRDVQSSDLLTGILRPILTEMHDAERSRQIGPAKKGGKA